MDPYPHGTKHLTGMEWVKAQLTIAYICALFLGIWLVWILFMGWFRYLFYPTSYIVRAGDIIADMQPDETRSNSFRRTSIWHDRYHCEGGQQAAALNDPDDMVMFVVREHPFFMDNEILYVKSPGYKARHFQDKVKVYRQS